MKRIRGAVLVAVILLVTASPGFAQEAVEVEATIGLQGYVVPNESATITVNVAADILFVGELQVTVGGVSLFSKIEVPAGSTKEYTFDMPGAGSTQRGLVRLYADGADEHLVERSITVLAPSTEQLVGVFDSPTIQPLLVASKSMPFGGSLNVLELTPADLAGDLGPLSYLVIGDRSLVDADAATLEGVSEWVADGGRIVGAVGDLARIAGELGPVVALGDGATVSSLGKGELITVDAVSAVSDWGSLVRDQPPMSLGTNNNDFFGDVGFQMVEAASAGSDSVTPGIPWLLGALGLYVLMVGPINFIVLRRLGRRELAWLTIPAMSVIMLAVLWVVGRSQLDDRLVAHASIVVQDGDNTRANSTMIVVAGGEGEHTIDVAENWSIAPLDMSQMFGSGRGLEASVSAAPGGGTRMGFELANLGAATVSAKWSPEPIPLRAEVSVDGDALSATMFNDSDIEFWGWGIAIGNSARAGAEPLLPGGSGVAEVRSGNGFNEGGGIMADAVMSQRNWEFDGEEDWRRVWPLSEAMNRLESGTLADGAYFFGFTNDFKAEVAIDGTPIQAEGPSLIVMPLDFDQPTPTSPSGEIVRIVGANFVDAYPGWIYASGADSVEFRFRVAAGTTGQVTLRNSGGPQLNLESLEVFNWETQQFDEYDWPGDFPADGHLSPMNEMMVRLFPSNADFEMQPNSLTLAVATP